MLKKRLRAGLIAALLFSFGLGRLFSAPAIYYVSNGTNGNIGDDSRSCVTASNILTPKLTVMAGVGCATAANGDTVYIRGGSYASIPGNNIDAQRFPVASGTSWANAVTISGYPGETVTINVASNYGGIGLSDSGPSPAAHYIIIQDLHFNKGGGAGEGVYIYTAHHIRMQRIDLYGGTGSNNFGVHAAQGSDYIELLDSTIHDVGDTSGGLTDGHCIYWTSSNSLILRNTVYNCGGYGIHLYGDVLVGNHNYPSNDLVEGNYVHHVGTHGGTAYGIVVSWGQDNIVRNNVVVRNPGGISLYSYSTRTLAYNNTVAFNTPYEGIMSQYYTVAPTITQNIVYSNAAGNIVDYGGGTGAPTLSNNVTVDPHFTDFTKNDFSLTAASAAALNIAACPSGVTIDYLGTSRPQGSNCDAGAYEYAPGGSNPPVITTAMLPDAQQGAVYSQLVCATNGTTPYLWTKPTGSLPTGVSLNNVTSTCVTLTGTLSAASTFTFTLLVTDAAALTDSQSYTVTITAVTTTCNGGSGAWTLRPNSCVGAGSSNGTATATTSAVTTIAGDIAFCAVADDNSQTQTPVTSSPSNTFTLMGTANNGEYGRAALYYSKLTSVGSTTFSAAPVGGALSYPAIQCMVFQGAKASPLDAVATGSGAVATTSIQTTTLSPVQTWTLTVAALQAEDANTVTSSGFTIYQLSYSLSKYFGVALAWAIQPATPVILPAWTWGAPMSVSTVAGTFLSGESYRPLSRRRIR